MVSFVGQTVSHYKILEQIGRGGMGLVYKAEDLALGRNVAVKFLPSDVIPNPSSRERFIREAQAASSLDHANICTIHEIGETSDGHVFIVMGYYEGETLKQKIEKGTLTLDETLLIGIQVCSGLAKVHEKGIIHRDIKPANVIVTNDGDARILDFGVASLAGGSSLTVTGHAVGTVAYMAPEQALGSPMDARSDLFSLGAMMYEMTTGNRPFTGDHEAAVMYSILHLDPPRPSSVRSEIPAPLDAVILKMLEKDPARRYQSAGELRSDLKKLAGHTAPGTTVALPERGRRLPKSALYASVLAGVALIGWLAFPRLFPGSTKTTPWRIGVLPFQTITRGPVPADWPRVVQMMIVDHLNRDEELRVIDPFTFASIAGEGAREAGNALSSARQVNADLLINGTIESLDTAFALRCTLTDVSSGLVKLSDVQSFSTDRDLPQAVRRISGQILSYFQIETLSGSGRARQDVQPWLNYRTKNLEAMKAFLQGAKLMGQWQPGADVYFKKAIDIDSTFVTPRSWLIAGLVNKGRLAEARPHQEFLMRHLFDAAPFEQALIRWTGAMMAGDVPGQAKALEVALEYSPNNDVLVYLLADIRVAMRDYAGAITAIRPAVESGWTFQPGSLLLGSCLFQLHKYSECRKVLERSLKLETVLSETYAILAVAAYHEGDREPAEGYAQEFLRRGESEGGTADSLFAFLGEEFGEAGLHAESAGYFEKAVGINPGKAEYHCGLARSALAMGDFPRAKNASMRALALDSTQLPAHEILGRVYEMTMDTSAAVRQYMIYLDGDSTSDRSREVRSRAQMLTRN